MAGGHLRVNCPRPLTSAPLGPVLPGALVPVWVALPSMRSLAGGQTRPSIQPSRSCSKGTTKDRQATWNRELIPVLRVDGRTTGRKHMQNKSVPGREQCSEEVPQANSMRDMGPLMKRHPCRSAERGASPNSPSEGSRHLSRKVLNFF